MTSRPRPLGIRTRLSLAAVILGEYVRVLRKVRGTSLQDLVRDLESRPPRVRLPPVDPGRLGRIVHRILSRPPLRARCLTMSLVHFRLLARQGTEARLIVGLPPAPESHEAHAWVEVEGIDVGPPPGRFGHEEMARYGGQGPSGP